MTARERKPLNSLLVAICTAAFVQACSSTASSIEERFAAATATTWRVAGGTKVFERTEARFSRSTRDYVYLGPVAINRRGSYEFLLWVGVGSTLDRGFLAPQMANPDAISIFIDGEPMYLTLAEWAERAPVLSGELPYDPSVPLTATLAARVTLNQIALIDSQAVDRVLLHTPDGSTREFYPWDAASWQTFVSRSP